VDHVPSVEIILPVRCGAPGRLRQLRTATWPRWRFQKAEAHPPCYRTNNICEHQVHSEQLQQHLRSNKVMVKSVQSQRAPLKLEIPLTTHTHVSYTRCNTGFLFGFGPDTGARALRYTIHSATPHTVQYSSAVLKPVQRFHLDSELASRDKGAPREGRTRGGRFWGVLCGQYPVLCTAPQRRTPGKFLLVENGRLEPRGWNSFQRGFKHSHQ
jgi:hypothetical protein